MLMKRVWDTSGEEPRLIGVKLLRAGRFQKFSPRIIERGIAEGWLEMGDNMVKLRTDPPATYKIINMPGFYCCFCDKRMDDSPSALEHVKRDHSKRGVVGGAVLAIGESPDPFNPSGYRKDNFYYCEKQKDKEVK